VTDNKLTIPAGAFPTTLQIGQSASAFFQGSWTPAQSPVVNTAMVHGVGAQSGTLVTASDQATATVLPISVACNIRLFAADDTDNNPNDNHLVLGSTGAGSTISGGFILTVQNTGQATVSVNATEVVNGDVTLSGCVDSGGNSVTFPLTFT